MSKHSKWSKIRHKKGAADAKRAANFTKLARAITVAAREGGGDPSFNYKLRTAIDSALAGNMTKENIDRAVKRGTGEVGGDQIEEVVYEGYGPAGVAVLVEALTDNRNRTSANLKHIFSKYGGNMAGSGSVLWMFEHQGVNRLRGGAPLGEEAELALIDAGAEDIRAEDGETVVVSAVESLNRVREVAQAAGLEVVSSELEWSAKDEQPAPPEARGRLEKLLEALDEDDDVQQIYSNVNLEA